jgi:hypothetical protein
MLNPYVPGNAGTVSATKKKAPASTDPQNSPMPDNRSAGPLTDMVTVGTASTTAGPSAGGEASNSSVAPMPTINAPNIPQANFGQMPSAPAGSRATASVPQEEMGQFAEDRLNNMLSSNSTYMNQARREGLLQAASRGGLNTSIAAGAAQREAINAAQPIALADAGFTQERYLTSRRALLEDLLSGNNSLRTMDQQDNQGRVTEGLNASEGARRSALLNQEADLTNQRDRALSTLRRGDFQFETNLRDQLANNETQRQAWLNTQTNLSSAYTQAFTDGMRTNLDFIANIGQAFIADPEVYSPDVVSGMTNFFRSISGGTTNTALAQILRDMMAFGGGGQATQPVVQPIKPVTVGG